MTNINEETGLPELPEGYFWRVKESFGQFTNFQIRKKLLFGSVLVTEGVTESWKLNDLHFRWMANYTYGKFDLRAGAYKYMGDYPPKRLELT